MNPKQLLKTLACPDIGSPKKTTACKSMWGLLKKLDSTRGTDLRADGSLPGGHGLPGVSTISLFLRLVAEGLRLSHPPPVLRGVARGVWLAGWDSRRPSVCGRWRLPHWTTGFGVVAAFGDLGLLTLRGAADDGAWLLITTAVQKSAPEKMSWFSRGKSDIRDCLRAGACLSNTQNLQLIALVAPRSSGRGEDVNQGGHGNNSDSA